MRHPSLVAAVLLLPSLVAAQSPTAAAAAAPRSGVMYEFDNFAAIFGSRLVAAFDSIPARHYGYRPTSTQQTIGYIAQHLENADYSLCERYGPLKHKRTAKDSLADTLKATWPKDTLVARLRASLRFCDDALAQVKQLESPELAVVLLAFETDLAEHYSQLAVYMRLLGMVPPSALPPRRHVAIELPKSALMPYVGVYDLPPDQELHVVLRDGALFIHVTNGVTMRLWPETRSDFFLKERDATITFTRDATRTVTGLVLHQFDHDRLARKLR